MIVVHTLLSAVAATGAGSIAAPPYGRKTLQVVGRTTNSTGSATVTLEVSNDKVNWITAASVVVALSTAEATGGVAMDASWKYVRPNVTALSGTGATVDAYLGHV